MNTYLFLFVTLIGYVSWAQYRSWRRGQIQAPNYRLDRLRKLLT